MALTALALLTYWPTGAGAGAAGDGGPTTTELFFVNGGSSSIDVFNLMPDDTLVPVRSAATGLSTILGIAIDSSHNELFVAALSSLRAYNLTDTLLRVIEAPQPTVPSVQSGFIGIDVDPLHDELFALYFVDPPNGTRLLYIYVYARTASGNAAPLRILNLNVPTTANARHAVDYVNSELFFLNANPATVSVYSRAASGDAAPLRVLSVIPDPYDLTLDLTNGELLVLSFDWEGPGNTPGVVAVYPRTASGSSSPIRALGGPATLLTGPRALALNWAHDELSVANLTGVTGNEPPRLTVYGRTASGNTAPRHSYDLPGFPMDLVWSVQSSSPGTTVLTVSRVGTGNGTITSSPPGISCPAAAGAGCSASFTSGGQVTLDAHPANPPIDVFTGWSGGGCGGTGTCVVTLTAPVTVTGTINATDYTLDVQLAGTGTGTVTSNPAGISCPSTCAALFHNGTSGGSVLTATPAAGSVFGGWSGDGCSGAGTCRVASTATVVATFHPVSTVSILDPADLRSVKVDANGDVMQPAALASLGSTRTGVAADGVTRLVLRASSDGPMTFTLSSAADGCLTTLAAQSACDASGGGPTSVTVPPTIVGGRSLVFALYVAPDGLGEAFKDTHSRAITLSINGAPPVPLMLWWPPVVLVHGLWGNSGTWKLFRAELAVSSRAAFTPEYSPNDAPFDVNRPFTANGPVTTLASSISGTRAVLQDEGIAVTQVDVVGHSMGGLVARAYSEYAQYRNPDNFMKGYIHKLVTVHTPHRGSGLAAFIRNNIPAETKECLGLGLGGAIDDLRALDSPPPGTVPPLTKEVGRSISTHVIGSIANDSTVTEQNIERAMAFCDPDFPLLGLWPGEGLVDSYLGGNGNHDTVVTIGSQLAQPLALGAASTIYRSSGLPAVNPGEHTTESIVHTSLSASDIGAVDSPTIQARIRSLLALPATAPEFTRPSAESAGSSAAPASATSPAPLPGPRAARAPAPLTVLQPAPGTVVHPGDAVLIRVAAPSGGAALASVMFSAGGGITVKDTSPFEQTYSVPPDAVGQITIEIAAFDVNGGRLQGSSFLVVQQTSALAGLGLEPTAYVFTTLGESAAVRVNGTFADGVIRDVTKAGTTYRTASGGSAVVDVTSDGVMVGRGRGSDSVIVENDTVSATLKVVGAMPFGDVPANPFHAWIEALLAAGITGGCSTSPPAYCPDTSVTRGQMAVFLLRGIHGAAYQPPPATGTMFTDVAQAYVFASWIEELARERITGGCSPSPLRYCSDTSVTRGQMAVFLMRAKHGADYQPPAATGIFADVAAGHPFAPWIEQLASEGITGGCGPSLYCPDGPVTRGQMAVFLVRAFNLPL